MKKLRSLKNYLTAGLWLIVLGLLWVTLAPTQLGGRFNYVIITGNSMLPLLQKGDLAVTQKTGDYRVGDIIVYHHPLLGPVIHRIIAVDNNRFVLQGDHNTWTDSYQPLESDVEGKLCFHLPRVGAMALAFRKPVGAALLAGIIGFILFWPVADEAGPVNSPGEAISSGQAWGTLRKRAPKAALSAVRSEVIAVCADYAYIGRQASRAARIAMRSSCEQLRKRAPKAALRAVRSELIAICSDYVYIGKRVSEAARIAMRSGYEHSRRLLGLK